MKKTNVKNAGFSLLELLFAMFFLSIIVFGVVKLHTSTITLSYTNQLELKARFYAIQGLEVSEALGYAALMACVPPCTLSATPDYAVVSGPPESLENGLFQRSIAHDETGLINASLITSTVTWTDNAGDHSVEEKRVVRN